MGKRGITIKMVNFVNFSYMNLSYVNLSFVEPCGNFPGTGNSFCYTLWAPIVARLHTLLQQPNLHRRRAF